jgi:hypothetical protein
MSGLFLPGVHLMDPVLSFRRLSMQGRSGRRKQHEILYWALIVPGPSTPIPIA